MPAGENSFYVDNKKASALYGTFIGKELVDFTRRTFPLSTKREETFIGGLSMGGFGSIVNGLQNPETFGAVCALSSALILDSMMENKEYTDFLMSNKGYYESVFGDLDQVKGGANDYDALAEKVAASGGPKPRFYLACGTEDGLIGVNRQFRDHLQALGYDAHLRGGPRGARLVLLGRVHLKGPEMAAPGGACPGGKLRPRGIRERDLPCL